MADAGDALLRQRFAKAQEALIARARPGTYFYAILAAFYVPTTLGRPVDLAVALIAVGVLLGLGIARAAFYRATPQGTLSPEKWRWTCAMFAASQIGAWDTFTAFEIWHRSLDAASMLLVAASLTLRATSTYTACPDRRVHLAIAAWSRLPLLVVPLAIGTTTAVVLTGLLLIHTVYTLLQHRQLNEEFWRAIEATERAEAAHAELRREVELRERAEVELRLAQKLESVGRLAAGIAHEINTPLQAMMGNLEFLSEGVTDLLAMAQPTDAQASDLAYLRENLPEALHITGACLERTAAIVKSVKTFAHPEVAKKSPVDLNRALQTTLDISRHEYAMIADVRTEFGELPLVECYAGELNQALLNIVINAAHAIGSRHAETGTRGTITIATRADDGFARIAIADTGGGIPEAIRERIFDPFFTTKGVGKGTGQGLAIARSVMHRHGGELTFDTELGRGTTFVIRLPIGDAALAAA